MHLRLKTAPAQRPVSLTQAKAHLRVEHDEHDTEIGLYLDIAIGHVDGGAGVLSRALVNQVWYLDLDAFPEPCDPIVIPLAPVQSVDAVTYVDSAGATQILDPALYLVHPSTEATPALVEMAPDASWPQVREQRRAVTVEFTAGYGPGDPVAGAPLTPAPIRGMILLMVGDLYANREAQVIAAGAIGVVENKTVARLAELHRFRPA